MVSDDYSQFNVLVVDDFKQFHSTISDMLESFGIKHIDTTASGSQAIKLCRAKTYDIILCDYNMGQNKKNGQQVLESLKFHKILPHQTLFLLVTAEVSKSMVMATYDNEPDAYIVKPFNAKLLKQRIGKLVTKRQTLTELNRLIEEELDDEAITECERLIESNGRHTLACQKLLSELYLKTKQYDQAETLYLQVLSKRDRDWAKLGLARTKRAQDDNEQALQLLEEVIEKTPHYMPAFDLMADIYEECNELDNALSTMRNVVSLSPNSILRHQRLAQVAEHTNDFAAATEAHLKSIELGTYSCYESEKNFLGLGRGTAQLIADNDPQAHEYAQKTLNVLKEVDQRFKLTDEAQLQVKLLLAQVHVGLDNTTTARDLLWEVEQVIDKESTVIGIDTALDRVKALNATNQQQRSKDILGELVKQHENDEKALEKLDRLLDEPRSKVVRKRVADINRDGISLYDEKRYKEAITVFRRAQKLFPKFIGVNLNLVQALNGEMRGNGYNDEFMACCVATLDTVASFIPETHEQFERYRQLYEAARELRSGR